MPSSLPPPSSVKDLSQDRQFQVLDTLFESSPELHTLVGPVLANQSFSSYSSLVDAVGDQMSALSASNRPTDRDILLGILGSHPRLGQPKTAAAEHLSELSKKEQAKLNTGDDGTQAAKLQLLNQEYELQFPGLRFVTFVNGRSRDAIIEEGNSRIARKNREQEIEDNIQAMVAIAKDRAGKLSQ
ncbi:Oxo-4-hydroxy-4-carboxy-5-ureidoimidazoline decarboxylase [Aspergillus unguis]